MVFLLLLSLSLVPLAYGLFGKHKTCPRCGGTGRDPGTLFLTPCPTCGGDGEVGIFMDDEDLEDSVSFLSIAAIVILLIVGVVVGSKRAIQSLPSKPKPIERETFETGVFCPYCGTRNTEYAIYCTKCGKKIREQG